MTEKQVGRVYPGIGCGVIILNKNKEVLLTLRNEGANNRAGLWELPGGTVEVGERIIDVAIREIHEEVNLVVEPLFAVGIYEDFIGEQHWLSIGVVADIQDGKVKNMEPHKFDEVKFFSINNLPVNTAKLAKAVISDYASGVRIPWRQITE